MQPTPKLLCLLFCCSACGAPTDGEAGPRLGGLSSQTIGLAHGIACVDDAHAAVATNRDGLQIVRLTAGAEPTVVARLPADQKVDSQASFLSAPGRLYFFNQTYGMLHVVDTRDADAPVELAALDSVPIGLVAGPGAVVFAKDAAGVLPVDMTDPMNPVRGAVGKTFQPDQKFTPTAGYPMALVGDVLLVLNGAFNEVYAFDVKNPMAPVEVSRTSLIDPGRPASRKVVANGWAVRGTYLYMGAVQLPDPPDFTFPARAISWFVVDVANPRAPRVVTYPKIDLQLPRVVRNEPKLGVLGIRNLTAGMTYELEGDLFVGGLRDPTAPTEGTQLYFGSNIIDSVQIRDACFAGDSIVVWSADRVAFGVLR